MARWLPALLLLLAGCASAPKPPSAPQAATPQAATPQAKPAQAAPEPQVSSPAPSKPAARAPAPAASAPPTAPKAPAPVVPARPAAPKAPPAAVAAKPPPAAAKVPAATAAPAPLDLKTLEERLKETDAIGLMTKLSLKNQVDDLVAEFRAYYAGRGRASLDELRRPYELLLMKVLALLQDRDPALARAVNASRDRIWAILSDRDKFSSTLS